MSSRQRACLVAVLVALPHLALAGAPPMTQEAAERLARSRWFSFELAPVQTRFKGDWVAFVSAKERDEAKAIETWRAPRGLDIAPDSALARGHRALAAEFELVAQAREAEARALAKRVLDAARKGELESLVDDCTMYDATAKDRRELTRAYLEKSAAAWKEAARLAGDQPLDLRWTSPSPGTGMPGMVHLSFGPAATPPKEPGHFPPRHELELWWSGEVMPEANGPVHGAPPARKNASRWRLYDLVLPYSRTHHGLQ